MSFEPPQKQSPLQRAGFLARPENISKAIISQIPVLGGLVEMSNQLGGMEIDRRLGAVEAELAQRVVLPVAPREAMPTSATPPAATGWPQAIAVFVKRIISLGVIYNAEQQPDEIGYGERILPMAQACLWKGRKFVTSREAIELASRLAEKRSGTLAVFAGMGVYELILDEEESGSGLLTGTVGARDEAKWEAVENLKLKYGIDFEESFPEDQISYSTTPLIGEDCGLLHPGEAKDLITLPNQFEHVQFDSFAISHCRMPVIDQSLMTFVSGVLPGRIVQCGSPVFNREGALLGLISGDEQYKGDFGRRAVVSGLLGHPLFPHRPR